MNMRTQSRKKSSNIYIYIYTHTYIAPTYYNGLITHNHIDWFGRSKMSGYKRNAHGPIRQRVGWPEREKMKPMQLIRTTKWKLSLLLSAWCCVIFARSQSCDRVRSTIETLQGHQPTSGVVYDQPGKMQSLHYQCEAICNVWWAKEKRPPDI